MFRVLRVFIAIGLGFGAVASASAQTPVTVEYYHLDAVGSVRAVTNQQGQVIRRHDYLPFGEEYLAGPATPDPLRFAGKERDADTGLDYFGARYYASRTGRFTTVDPLMDVEGALFNPQQWNRYAYVSNNPLRYRDPDGRRQEGAMHALERDIQALHAGHITLEEYHARIRARGAGAIIGGVIAAGPIVWRAAVSCFLSPSCQSSAIDLLEGAAGGPPRIAPTGDIDAAATALAQRLGGRASVAIDGFGPREFDAVSDIYVGQTFGGTSALLKPDNFLSSSRREQIRVTLEAAKATGRKALFEFRNGVHDDVLDFISRNANRIGVKFDVYK